MALNMTKEIESKSSTLPAGKYAAKIILLEDQVSKAGNEMIVVTYKTETGAKKIKDYIIIDPESKAAYYGQKKISALYKAIGIKTPEEVESAESLSEIMFKRVELEIDLQDTSDGKKRNNVVEVNKAPAVAKKKPVETPVEEKPAAVEELFMFEEV